MTSRRHKQSDAARQLPFTGDNVSETDFHQDLLSSGSNTVPRSRPIRAVSSASNTFLSSSYSSRAPARSFAHQATHRDPDTPQYSSQGVRERTQELASYALDSDSYQERDRRTSYTGSDATSSRRAGFLSHDLDAEGRTSSDSFGTDPIVEEDSEPEPESPETIIRALRHDSSSPGRHTEDENGQLRPGVPNVVVQDPERNPSTERTPLLPKPRLTRTDTPQKKSQKGLASVHSTASHLHVRLGETFIAGREHVTGVGRSLLKRENYTKEAAIAGAAASLQTISAVFLGLLLNILDALSYGYILFPLGSPIFSSTGPDGISIFFVSCIVSQLCYSLGLSVFRGGGRL